MNVKRVKEIILNMIKDLDNSYRLTWDIFEETIYQKKYWILKVFYKNIKEITKAKEIISLVESKRKHWHKEWIQSSKYSLWEVECYMYFSTFSKLMEELENEC